MPENLTLLTPWEYRILGVPKAHRPHVGMMVAAVVCLSWVNSLAPAGAQSPPPAGQKQDQQPAPAAPPADSSNNPTTAPPAPTPPPPSREVPPPAALPNTPVTPPAAAPPPGGPPPLPVLLGFADFMLTLDRPYEAEKIYNGILHFDPTNAAALHGLQIVSIAKKPTFQVLAHYYNDNHDVEMFTYGGGPTFRTKYGKITFTSGTGTYRNNNDPTNHHNPLSLTPMIPIAADNNSLQKSTFNLILEPYFGKWDGTIFVSHVVYDGAPDRTLWDLRASYVTDARTSYTASHGRHDSFYQNQSEQFFAPETYFELVDKITFQDTSLMVQHPIVGKLDLTAAYRYFSYSDGNTRDNYRVLTMYRLKGDQKHPMPVFRVGLDTILDNSKFFTLIYSSSRQFNAMSAAADYVWLSRRTKYGFFASYPIAKQHFDPPAALVAFYSHKIENNFEFYVNVAGFLAPGDRTSLDFGDYIMGLNMSF